MPPPSASDEHHRFASIGLRSGRAILHVSARSDPGCVRANNEDAFTFCARVPEEVCLLAVADGMGGMAGGEVASAIAIETVESAFLADGPRTDPDAVKGERVREEPLATLHGAFLDANRRILDRSAREIRLMGMGTTCTAVVVAGSDLHVAHIGDSRAYVIQTGSIVPLTKDHSVSGDAGRVGRTANARARTMLTRYLGSPDHPIPSLVTSHGVVTERTCVLLCSDGLTSMVGDAELVTVIGSRQPDDATRILIDLARERGGPDNITIVLARVSTT